MLISFRVTRVHDRSEVEFDRDGSDESTLHFEFMNIVNDAF